MRRFTLAVLALGCLSLGLATFIGPNAASISVPVLAAPTTETPCTQSCSFGEPGATDKDDHFSFCHVDHGGEAHVICPDSSSIAHPHLDTHEFDFCINTLTDLANCVGKKG